jgi:hypothetical protein
LLVAATSGLNLLSHMLIIGLTVYKRRKYEAVKHSCLDLSASGKDRSC